MGYVEVIHLLKFLQYLGNSDHNIIVCNLICDVGLSKNEEPVRTYQVIKLFVPLGHAKNRKIPSWMSKAAKSAVKFESRMWTGCRQSKNYNDLVEYRIAQNKAVE